MRAVRPRGATVPPARSGEIDAKHAQLMSAFVAATRSGDLSALTQLLANDVRVVPAQIWPVSFPAVVLQMVTVSTPVAWQAGVELLLIR